jgi:hypothetical protein
MNNNSTPTGIEKSTAPESHDHMTAQGTPCAGVPLPWFVWHGQKYTAIINDSICIIACPICGNGIPCDGPPRDEMTLAHRVTVAPDGAMNVHPSIICPRDCGWHVVISNGQAS